MMPKSIQVGPVRYSISVSKNLGVNHGEDGFTNTNLGTIELSDDLHPDQQRLTLFHELGHACFNHAFEPEDEKSKYTQEEVMRILMPTLLDTCRRNPDLASYLFGGAQCPST